MTIAFVFPGQGSQSVGMLDAVAGHPVVAQILAQADQALGEPLSALIASGPAEALSLTVNTQPAMLVAGYACCAAWRAAGGPDAVAVAGHSLGEYTALVAADALSLPQAVALVRLRAQAMQEAVPVGTGGMAVIMGLDDDAVKAACAAASTPHDRVEAVNFNAPAQVVIAGHKAAVERACENAKQAGAKRALPLAVSAPFHSSLLAPAGVRLAAALADADLRSPRIPLVNNVDVAIEAEPARIIDALVRQASAPVRWVEVVQRLKAMGVDQVIEFGPGKVLTGLIPRIDKSIKALSVFDPASLQAALVAVNAAPGASA